MSLTPERIKELNDYVRGIAAHLGWEFDEEYAGHQEQTWSYNVQIKSGDKRISFSTSEFTGKLRFIIRAVFPKDKRGQLQTGGYNTKHPEISVAIARGPEKIAHAIQSRLLPEYEEQLAVALDHVEKSNAYHAGRMQTLKTVAEYFGQTAPENDDKAIYPPGGHEKLGFGIYKIETVSEGVKFEVSCSIDKALKIFNILKQS